MPPVPSSHDTSKSVPDEVWGLIYGLLNTTLPAHTGDAGGMMSALYLFLYRAGYDVPVLLLEASGELQPAVPVTHDVVPLDMPRIVILSQPRFYHLALKVAQEEQEKGNIPLLVHRRSTVTPGGTAERVQNAHTIVRLAQRVLLVSDSTGQEDDVMRSALAYAMRLNIPVERRKVIGDVAPVTSGTTLRPQVTLPGDAPLPRAEWPSELPILVVELAASLNALGRKWPTSTEQQRLGMWRQVWLRMGALGRATSDKVLQTVRPCPQCDRRTTDVNLEPRFTFIPMKDSAPYPQRTGYTAQFIPCGHTEVWPLDLTGDNWLRRTYQATP